MTDHVPFAEHVDHVVINVIERLDAAAEAFSGLGFCLSPRGHHSLGSINHLIMFVGAYLELIGIPANAEVVRAEIRDSPPGINGLVYADANPEARCRALSAAGLRPAPPQTFSRPVATEDGERPARFTSVRLPGDTFPAGRVYFCQHHTPELVWREQWMRHPNGADRLKGLTIVCQDPEADAHAHARVLQATPSRVGAHWTLTTGDDPRDPRGSGPTLFRLWFIGERDYRERFGTLGCRGSGRTSWFGAIHCQVASLERLGNLLATSTDTAIRWQLAGDAIWVSLPDFNTLLEFRE